MTLRGAKYQIDLVFDELDEMSPKKLLLSTFYATISGVIAAWLVLKVLESKGCGPKGTHEEIREVRDEQNDRDNPADKLPEENDERLDKKAEEHEEMH